MAKLNEVHGLQLPEDMEFQRRSWVIERIGWTLMGVAVAASAAGLTGPGPLSRARETDPVGLLELEYFRVERRNSDVSLRVTASSGTVAEGRLRLLLGHEYLRKVRVERVVPEPVAARTGAEGVTYSFLAGPSGPVRVAFHARAEESGGVSGRLSIPEGPALEFGQVILP